MKINSVILIALAVVAGILGLWVFIGVVAWVIRVVALILLVLAVLSARRKLTDDKSPRLPE